MNEEQIKALMADNLYTFLVLQVVIGLVFGAIPLILGIRRGKKNLGIVGFILSGIIGAFSPFLSIVTAALFTFLVVRKTRGPEASQDPAD